MSEFYEINSTSVSHRELWWWSKSPLVLLGWIIKWLRIRVPCSSDDPNVESTLPFVTEVLPPQVRLKFDPLIAELEGLGFCEPVYHVIEDAGTRTTVYWASFLHNSGKHFARILHRVWQQAQKSDRGLFPMFFTAFTDGTFLVSSAGKPDMAAPKTVSMIRLHGAKVSKLWAAHETKERLMTERLMISPIETREELLAATERHHVLVRDFHLARGVFRRRTPEEQSKAEAFSQSVAQARALGLEHGEIVAELDKLQEQKPAWAPAIWVLVGSLVMFLLAGAANWDWKFTLWIIPVLLFHEAGHWVAMRLFNYRNLRLFFIPFFGAAVSGQNWNVAGWKKALVSLAGPLPGIALGTVLGVAGIVLHRSWLNQAALVLLLTNGFNLIPILPLDGGHVLQDLLFCRNRWLDGLFRILAIVGLVALGLLLGAKFLPYIAIPMAIALPVAFKLGKVTDEMRRQTLPEPELGQDRIPTPTAQAIISAVRGAFPAKAAMSNKVVAQHTLIVFERLNAKPPGALATFSILLLHGGAVVATLLVTILLLVNKHAPLGDFMAAAARQPAHRHQSGDVETWPAPIHGEGGSIRNLIVTDFKNRAAAASAFVQLTNKIAAPLTLMRFSDSLLLSLPAADDAAREHWFDVLQVRSTNLFVALSNAPVRATLTFLAPSPAVATNLALSLADYLALSAEMDLVAPWAPEAQRSDFATYQRERRQWLLIGEEVGKAWEDASLKPYVNSIAQASKRGAAGEVVRLVNERAQKLQELQAQTRQRLAGSSANLIDPALLELHARLNSPSLTNASARKAVLQEVEVKLGKANTNAPSDENRINACGVVMGVAYQHGLLIELSWLHFRDVTRGLPALTEWASAQGCNQIKYELESSGWSGSEPGEEAD